MQQRRQDTPTGMVKPSLYDCELPPEARAELGNISEFLPSDARSELLQPRRPRILTRPPSPPKRLPGVNLERSSRHPTLGWLLALAGVAALCAVIGLSWPSPEKRAAALQESAARSRAVEQKAREALETLRSSKPSVQPTPMPTPAQPVSQPPGPPPPAVSAPRARLVLYKRSVGNGVYELVDSTGRTVNILVDSAPRATSRAQLVELTPEHIDESHRITMPYGTEVRATLRGFLGAENQLPRVGQIGDMYVVGTTPWIWVQVPGTAVPTWVDP